MKRGDQGSNVERLQTLLTILNYNVVVDGVFGRETENAIMAFQRGTFLPVTGMADEETQDKLTDLSQAMITGSSSNKYILGAFGIGVLVLLVYAIWKEQD